jgi:hypothetical protein
VLDGFSNAVTEKQVCSYFVCVGSYEDRVNEIAATLNRVAGNADRLLWRDRGRDSAEYPIAQNEDTADESDSDSENSMLRVHQSKIPLEREAVVVSAIGIAATIE